MLLSFQPVYKCKVMNELLIHVAVVGKIHLLAQLTSCKLNFVHLLTRLHYRLALAQGETDIQQNAVSIREYPFTLRVV